MSTIDVIGIDPGSTTGLVHLRWNDRLAITHVIQCGTSSVLGLVNYLAVGNKSVVLAVEKFVVGPRAGKSASTGAGKATRKLIEDIRAYADIHGLKLYLRSASEVKPWGTDKRIEAAGMLDLTRGMPHARDAARHALYAAHHDLNVPDPLSKKWSA